MIPRPLAPGHLPAAAGEGARAHRARPRACEGERPAVAQKLYFTVAPPPQSGLPSAKPAST